MKYSSFIALMLITILGFQCKEPKDSGLPRMVTGIIVSDLEKSLDFYTNVLGMTQADTFHASADLITDAGFPVVGKAVDVIGLKLNEPGFPEYKVVKIQGITSSSMTNFFQPGTRMISIFVNDLDPYIARMKERNIKILSKTIPLTAPQGFKVIVLQGPDGELIEMMSP